MKNRPELAHILIQLRKVVLQLNDCVMETFCWPWGGLMSIGDPITATRVRVEM